MITDELLEKLENNEEVYFENQFAEIVYRCLPDQEVEGKRRGEKPYFIQIGNTDLADAISERRMITKEEFENF